MKKYFALLGALLLACGSASYSHAEQAPQAMSTQLTNVSGTVTDENGDPVIGASVSEIGTTRATATDINGRFNLRASGKSKIQISYVGYKTVTLEPGSNMNIQLTEDNALLDALAPSKMYRKLCKEPFLASPLSATTVTLASRQLSPSVVWEH